MACTRRGNPDDARRDDLACRGGGPRHGQALRLGARGIYVDQANDQITAQGQVLRKGDIITIDGSTGQVMRGEIPTIKPELSGDFATLMEWADAVRSLGIRANADTPADARLAREFGAEGIGLCRTEHMFFDTERIAAVRQMILASTPEGRRAALARILPMHEQDFIALFEIMAGLPVTIRLLDPPLHEFLPSGDEEVEEVARAIGADPATLAARVMELREFNPMLGPSRRPAGDLLSRDRRHAGSRHFRGGGGGGAAHRHAAGSRGDDPAYRNAGRVMSWWPRGSLRCAARSRPPRADRSTIFAAR
jgi:phosphoenolpyruvate synthase/pyruvate phosphate dikinase